MIITPVSSSPEACRGGPSAGVAYGITECLHRTSTNELTTRGTQAPDGIYWHGAGFFSMQRGLTWHTLHDSRYAARAAAEAQRAVAVCRATRSTQLAASLRKVHAQLREIWPTMPAVRELGDEVRTLVRAR